MANRRLIRPNLAEIKDKAATRPGSISQEDERLRDEVQNYGPKLICPVKACREFVATEEGYHLGSMTEHLFEDHKWSVMKIDKWLAKEAEVDYEEYQEAYG